MSRNLDKYTDVDGSLSIQATTYWFDLKAIRSNGFRFVGDMYLHITFKYYDSWKDAGQELEFEYNANANNIVSSKYDDPIDTALDEIANALEEWLGTMSSRVVSTVYRT
jgi:hypothetical protein